MIFIFYTGVGGQGSYPGRKSKKEKHKKLQKMTESFSVNGQLRRGLPDQLFHGCCHSSLKASLKVTELPWHNYPPMSRKRDRQEITTTSKFCHNFFLFPNFNSDERLWLTFIGFLLHRRSIKLIFQCWKWTSNHRMTGFNGLYQSLTYLSNESALPKCWSN